MGSGGPNDPPYGDPAMTTRPWPVARALAEAALGRPAETRAAFLDSACGLVFGDREPLVRVLTTRAGLTRFEKYGGVIGCDPRFDPLWSDARFRDAMHRVGIEPCPLARPWPLPTRAR